MLMAADLSCRMGRIGEQDVQRVEAILAAAQLPLGGVDGVSAEQLRQLMSVDKKVLDGELRLVLFSALGQAEIVADAPDALIMRTLADYIV